MIAIPGYQILAKIYDGSRTLVYRGRRSCDGKPVAIKILNSEYPTFSELIQFRNQYAIAKNLDFSGIVQPYSLENYRNGLALVMEDFGGISLHDYRANQPLRVGEFFNIAIAIARILEGLYRHRVIHKDIKPENILINPHTKQVKLTDFSIATLLPRETQILQNPNVLEGTLAYMSPEQTGRMNRGIDYRTDFYSLGVTFYELLTGQLPFQSSDPMELVYCHIARQPTPPIELVPTLPLLLNDITVKLMAKTAEERYQSALGLRHDLEICWQKWQSKSPLNLLILGERDISDRFAIPEKLYGRESEVSALLEAFNRVSHGTTEIMLVAGFSGIGKTAVVNEVHKPIVRQRGYFIAGKFDQFKRNIPFSAFVQAFQNLIQQLLTETAEALQAWKAEILEALGENARVIIEVIPELELLLGEQPPVPELEGSAAQNRFNLLFGKFIRVFTRKEHPLVIFADDLQWADPASLKLIQLLMSETDTGYLLLIGAYRDNEVAIAHPLMLTLEEIRKAEASVSQITLAPLDKSSLNLLIADTLSCPPVRALPLTELVIAKTQGNPFFTAQFLKYLHQERLISYDFDRGYWQCDIAGVTALSASDDVVEFMAVQLKKLPENTQNVLKLAACIGNQFDLATLAIVSEKSEAETAVALWRALQEGLVLPISEVYKLFQESDAIAPASVKEVRSADLSVSYKFLHDRVQQAAYFLIPEDRKQATHLKIGQLLLTNTSPEEREEKIFEIVNQLNMGGESIARQAERDELARLNLIAARKAKASTAYAAALKYLNAGMELLADSSWETLYDLTFALHEEAAEVSFLCGEWERMEQFTSVVLQQAKTILEKVKVYDIKIISYDVQGNLKKAIQIGLEALNLLGFSLPDSPSPSDIERGLEQTKAYFSGKNIEDLIALPAMTNAYSLGALRLGSRLVISSYVAAPNLFMMLAFEQVILSIQYGNAPLSACGYADYGIISIGLLQEIDSGYKFGKLALDLLDFFKAKDLKTRTMVKVAAFTEHWNNSVRESLFLLREAYKNALEIGDIDHVGYATYFKSIYAYFCGMELAELESEIADYSALLAQLKQKRSLSYLQQFHQAILNLMSQSANPCCLTGDVYSEEEALPIFLEANDGLGAYHFYLNKLILHYIFNDLEGAIAQANIAAQYANSATAMFSIPVCCFYESLSRLGNLPNLDDTEKENCLEKVRANQQKMEKWAQHSPANHRHKFELVEAELCRVLGENVEAMDCYDRAIAGARENQYLNEEAIANELAAKFYLDWGKEKIARVYLTDAYYCYTRWGALAKVADLEKRYPELLAAILNQTRSKGIGETLSRTKTQTATSSSTGTSAALDLATVIKASHALSGEIIFDRLLSTLMEVAIENAAAEKGAMILQQGDAWVLAAYCVSSKTCNLHFSTLSDSEQLPLSLINYVSRTREILVIDDTRQAQGLPLLFAADPYIIHHQPKSILCTPIQNQGKLIGILYLENNLTAGAFTSDRLEVLNIISSQAAISIENALLYRTLEAKVEERTAQLAAANREITLLNGRLKAENIRMSAELDVARRLQLMLLPKQSELNQIPGLEIAGFMEPADEVGGDYYDVLQHEGKVKIAIGDVTGHGLESGVLMLMVQTAVRTMLSNNETELAKYLQAINQTIYGNVQRMNSDKNLTLLLINYCEGKLRLSGQHEQVIVVRAGGSVELIDTIDLGFPIGLDSEIVGFVAEYQMSLNAGDGLVLYTDGITEAEDINGVQYGLDRLLEVLFDNWQRSAAEINQAAIASVRQHIGEQKLYDDITLLVLKQK